MEEAAFGLVAPIVFTASSILSPQSEIFFLGIFSFCPKIIASPFRRFYLARHPIGIAFALPDVSELAHQVASWSNGSP